MTGPYESRLAGVSIAVCVGVPIAALTLGLAALVGIAMGLGST